MHLSFYEIINTLVILIVVGILIYYFWSSVKDKPLKPVTWKEADRSGILSHALVKAEKGYADKIRFFNWWLQVERIKAENIPGHFAELGVYKGDSARIIHLMEPGREFHLFDTFEGFPGADLTAEKGKAATYTPQHFGDTSLEKAMQNIEGNENIIFHQGYFPETANAVTGEKFALVNMDADLYKPTRAGLEFFYPRVSPGGVIIIHDYNPKWPGILKAVDDFAATIPESPVILPDLDGTVMIIKSKSFQSSV